MTGIHQQYYGYATGRWHGQGTVAIRDWGALWRSPMAWSDKLSNVGLWLLGRVFGPATLTTWMQPTDDPLRFEHRAELRRFGMVIYRGLRTLHLLDDGRSVRIEGTEASFPVLAWTRPMPEGRATVRDDRHADYEMWVGGQPWTVAFEIGPVDGLSQLTCTWGSGEERLARAD